MPGAGNYLIVPIEGKEKGKVFECDGFEFIEVGENLGSFISHISNPTLDLVLNIASHTRFFDGKTDTQWLPKRYE